VTGWRVGVDSGGTVADICLFNEADSELLMWNLPSTPDDPSHAIAGGVTAALEMAGTASCVSYFGQGTTVANNALKAAAPNGPPMTPFICRTRWGRSEMIAPPNRRQLDRRISRVQQTMHLASEFRDYETRCGTSLRLRNTLRAHP
jgi:N-methylhydantoinase A/oxoprolinase/acetone carboxylase beta subunit